MAPNPKTSGKSMTASSGSPNKKAGRKPIGKVLQYSPREKVTRVNKVFVVGTQFGIILMRTERQTSKDDAYTNDVIKLIEDDSTGVAAQLQIIKICSRRQSQFLDRAYLQTSVYPSQWFVTQLFTFAGDETKMLNDKIVGTLDEYLLNHDIASILKTYVFDDFESFLEDEEAIHQVFGVKATSTQARNWLVDGWLKSGSHN
jgi:hypothetical protein